MLKEVVNVDAAPWACNETEADIMSIRNITGIANTVNTIFFSCVLIIDEQTTRVNNDIGTSSSQSTAKIATATVTCLYKRILSYISTLTWICFKILGLIPFNCLTKNVIKYCLGK